MAWVCSGAMVLLLNALERRHRADRRALLLEVTEVVEQQPSRTSVPGGDPDAAGVYIVRDCSGGWCDS
jgi:hypothetical protein